MDEMDEMDKMDDEKDDMMVVCARLVLLFTLMAGGWRHWAGR